MKKEDKKLVIDSLTERVKVYKHLYISDISELDAADTQALRKACFDAGVKLVQVKNTLLHVALKEMGDQYSDLFATLKGSSALMLSDTGNAPAKLIKNFRKTHDKPILKSAYVEECVYVGEENLDALVNIKSKEELLGDIVLLLQSPMQKLLSALESGKNTICGELKTLEERA